MNIVANRIVVNSIPLEFISASKLMIIRGAEPYIWEILVSDYYVDKWRALKNPVTITLITPTAQLKQARVVLKRWYITEIVPFGKGVWKVSIADVRWLIMDRSFVGGWNIESIDGRLRQADRTTSAAGYVTCIEAATEAMQLMKEKIAVDVDKELQNIRLPKNLGDSEGSGFTHGNIRTVEMFLEFCRCDISITRDGKILFTDRKTDKTKGLMKTPTRDGAIGLRDLHWAKPKTVNVTFEQRIERRIEIDLGAQESTLVGDPTNLYADNVIPDYDPTDVPQLREDGSEIVSWATFREFLLNRCNQSYSEFLDRYLKPTGISDNKGNAYQVNLMREYERHAREALFSYWKINLDTTGVGRVYERIKLGRLGPKGMNLPARFVHCDYSRYLSLAVDVGGSEVERIYSKKQLFDADKPAPFIASWVSDGQGSLVFKISAENIATFGSRLQLGLIDPDIGYGDDRDVANGVNHNFPDQCKVKPQFKAHIYWNGLWVGGKNKQLVSNKAFLDRLHVISNKAFDDGEKESITIFIRNTQAYWGFDENAPFPGILLNKGDLESRAKEVTKQIKETFEDANAGIATSSYVEHLENYWIGGNIYNISIDIGIDQPGSIGSTFLILPEVRGPIVSSSKELDGMMPELVA